jgi:hypothetical protein
MCAGEEERAHAGSLSDLVLALLAIFMACIGDAGAPRSTDLLLQTGLHFLIKVGQEVVFCFRKLR